MSIHIEARAQNTVCIRVACHRCDAVRSFTGLSADKTQVADRDKSDAEEVVMKTFPAATEAARYLAHGDGWTTDGTKDGCPEHPIGSKPGWDDELRSTRPRSKRSPST